MKNRQSLRAGSRNGVRYRASGRGFTLIEMLIAITIILILITLTGVATVNLLQRAREQATAATINKINQMLVQRLEGFDRSLNTPQFTRIVNDEQMRLENNQVYGVSAKAIQAVGRKFFLMSSFPQRFEDGADVMTIQAIPAPPRLVMTTDANNDGVPDGDGVSDLFQRIQIDPQVSYTATSPSSDPNPTTISSELLYYALTRMEVFGVAAVGDDAFGTNEKADTDNDGLIEFVDAWGNPLRFYRWPTRLIKPYGAVGPNGQPGNVGDDGGPGGEDAAEIGLVGSDDHTITTVQRQGADLLIKGLPSPPAPGQRDMLNDDPDDPLGLIMNEVRRLIGSAPNVAGLVNEILYPTIDTYHVPLIVSAGADGILGLEEPFVSEVDANGNFSIDAVEDVNGNGRLDHGNLAHPSYGTDLEPGQAGVDDDGNGTVDDESELMWPGSDEFDELSDNITNRNQRAGGT